MCSDSERLRSRGNYSESLLEQQEIPSHLAVPLHLRARNLTGTDESLVRSGLTGHAWPTHQPSWADFDTRAQDGGPGPSGQKMCGADGFGRLVGHLPLWWRHAAYIFRDRICPVTDGWMHLLCWSWFVLGCCYWNSRVRFFFLFALSGFWCHVSVHDLFEVAEYWMVKQTSHRVWISWLASYAFTFARCALRVSDFSRTD
jgi:hypothetical protein